MSPYHFIDRKHFPWEDYDEWLFGEEGLWRRNATAGSFPHYLVVHVGLHTCVHTWSPQSSNTEMIARHEKDLQVMVKRIQQAVQRTPAHLPRTLVVYQLPGRAGGSDARQDRCSREFNRILAREAHAEGYAVLEREELERRLLFRSEFLKDHRTIKPNLHLEAPAPNIVATSLLYLLSCLHTYHNLSNAINSTSMSNAQLRVEYRHQLRNTNFRPKDLDV